MQPGVRPIFCSDDVTKPGMRRLMRHQPVGITIQSGTVVMQGKIGLGRDGLIGAWLRRTPTAVIWATAWSRSGVPKNGTSPFGVVSVMGRRRVPSPAASSTAW